MKKRRLVNSHTIFIATLIVIPVMVLLVYVTGLKDHRSLYLNSLISTTIVSIVLLFFITTGLYNGWKLKDTIGKLNRRYRPGKLRNLPNIDMGGFDMLPADSIGGILLSILLWIIVAIFASVVLYYVAGILWLSILSVGAVLYWIFFRAFRLVLKKAAVCKGDMVKSIITAIVYTVLYDCWIYMIIVGVHFLRK